ncbi:hypothetical protein CPAR01_16402 [Colletotrichum paranaense]|uniref:Uncharacterized protein n=1 Tax=Colletotrichum paranaense TaxID=1914294 RepID=A0ABQ9RVW2_9PEZI|nr:uncharacterized protein CPAR01_16402 [Colletotrichum paranaense]KAK1516083.1 hypothetical protein CPAR01_16402 [Colletotrichum paranaense]
MSVPLIMLRRKFPKPGNLDGARALSNHRRGTWLECGRGCQRGTCEVRRRQMWHGASKLSHLQMKVDSDCLFVKNVRVKPRLDSPFRSDMGSMCSALAVL